MAPWVNSVVEAVWKGPTQCHARDPGRALGWELAGRATCLKPQELAGAGPPGQRPAGVWVWSAQG